MRTLIVSHSRSYAEYVSGTPESIDEMIIDDIKSEQQMFSIPGTIVKLQNKYIKDCYGYFIKSIDTNLYLRLYIIFETSPFFNLISGPGSPMSTITFKNSQIVPSDSILFDAELFYDMTRTLKSYKHK